VQEQFHGEEWCVCFELLYVYVKYRCLVYLQVTQWFACEAACARHRLFLLATLSAMFNGCA
jgi:hypothetical protein